MSAFAYKPEVSDYATRGGEASARLSRGRKKAKSSRQCRNENMAAMRLNKEPELKGNYDIRYALWVVKASDLCEVVEDWAERRRMDYMTACIYIASELGCHEDVIYKLRRKEWASFEFADALLIVLGLHFSLINGEIPYYANPSMKRSTWYAKAKAEGIECPAQEWVISNPAAA